MSEVLKDNEKEIITNYIIKEADLRLWAPSDIDDFEIGSTPKAIEYNNIDDFSFGLDLSFYHEDWREEDSNIPKDKPPRIGYGNVGMMAITDMNVIKELYFVLEVHTIEELRNSYCRVKHIWGRPGSGYVQEIGHIIKNKWVKIG